MFFTATSTDQVAPPKPEASARNLYRQWLMSPDACRRQLRDGDALTSGDVVTVERWAREANWLIALHDDADGQLQVIELFGPEFGEAADPIGLVYRAEQGFQIDEWTGRSWQQPSLGEALALAEARL